MGREKRGKPSVSRARVPRQSVLRSTHFFSTLIDKKCLYDRGLSLRRKSLTGCQKRGCKFFPLPSGDLPKSLKMAAELCEMFNDPLITEKG